MKNKTSTWYLSIFIYINTLMSIRVINGKTQLDIIPVLCYIYITRPQFIIRDILLDFGSTTIIPFYNIYHNHRNNNILAPLDQYYQ